MENTIEKIAKLINEEVSFTGGPIKDFEKVGRDTFITLLQNGLRPDHKILDFGCGALRLGYWIVRFMDDNKYYGIEPNERRLESGKKYCLGEEIIHKKTPKFSTNSSCDFSVFNTKFDFVVARSILTHTSPAMFRKIIKEFKESGNEGAIMLASYWPKLNWVDKKIKKTFSPGEGINGDRLDLDDWRFIKVIKYSFNTVELWSKEFGLKVSEFKLNPLINGQVWLKFENLT